MNESYCHSQSNAPSSVFQSQNLDSQGCPVQQAINPHFYCHQQQQYPSQHQHYPLQQQQYSQPSSHRYYTGQMGQPHSESTPHFDGNTIPKAPVMRSKLFANLPQLNSSRNAQSSPHSSYSAVGNFQKYLTRPSADPAYAGHSSSHGQDKDSSSRALTWQETILCKNVNASSLLPPATKTRPTIPPMATQTPSNSYTPVKHLT